MLVKIHYLVPDLNDPLPTVTYTHFLGLLGV